MAEAVRHDKTARQLRLLSDALDSGRLGPVRRMVNTLAPAEIGNLLESLPPDKRMVMWGLVDPEDDGEVLAALEMTGIELVGPRLRGDEPHTRPQHWREILPGCAARAPRAIMRA